MTSSFPDRLARAISTKNSRVCVGLDPRPDMLPQTFTDGANGLEGIYRFCRRIIDATAEYAACVKLQAAYFEALAPGGLAVLWRVAKWAHLHGLPIILDAKRNDIGSTAQAYASATFGRHWREPVVQADAVTVNPYLGYDGVQPFLDVSDELRGGVFVLVKTSNPSSGELQDLKTATGRVYEVVARMVSEWGATRIGECGYSSVGAVVGATYPQQLAELRALMPQTVFLVPGYGAQGGGPEDVAAAFDADGLGAIVNSSRGIIYAYRETGGDFQQAAAEAARTMRDDLNSVLP
jgi:orotidine-5'-phosphate decarboxylase